MVAAAITPAFEGEEPEPESLLVFAADVGSGSSLTGTVTLTVDTTVAVPLVDVTV